MLGVRAYGECPANEREREPIQNEYVREYVALELPLNVCVDGAHRCGCVDVRVSLLREDVRVNAVHCILSRHRVS